MRPLPVPDNDLTYSISAVRVNSIRTRLYRNLIDQDKPYNGLVNELMLRVPVS